jgi:amino acid permease
LNIIGDISSPVLVYWLKQWGVHKLVFLADRRLIIAVSTLVVILPITYSKNMKVLGVASFIAIVSAAYTVIYVDVTGGMYLANSGFAAGTNLYINLQPNFFIAIPLICLSFQCHIHVVPIYHSLQRPTYLRMFIVIVVTMIICFLFYASVGFFGYTTFGSSIRGNAMLNYPLDDIFAGIGRFGVGILVALSYPLRWFATRNVIESLFFKNGLGSELDFAFTTIFVVLTIIASILFPDIVDVFGIIGSIGAVSVMFIFPGMLLWTKKGYFWKFVSVPVVLLGLAMGIVGTIATLMSIYKKYFARYF